MSVRRRWPLALLALGVLLALAGGWLLTHRSSPTGLASGPAPSPLIGDFPSSDSGDSPDGMRILMPALGINLPMVAGDGYNAPLNVAATYPDLKIPGQGGRSVIYAHARDGMFGPLFNAKVGQEVDITRPGQSTLRYRVTEYYRRWPISDVRWLQPADHEELVLTTCTTYNYNDPRIVAVAEPI